MKSIGEVLSNDERWQRLMEKAQQSEDLLYKHELIQWLMNRFPEEKFALSELYEYRDTNMHCTGCTGLETCRNFFIGHRKTAFVVSGRVELRFSPCEHQQSHDHQRKLKSLVKSQFVPDHIMNTTFEALEKDVGRIEAIKAAINFCVSFERGKTTRGLYIYGPFGVGKSAIAGAMTQELAKRGVDVLMLYVPDYLMEIKASIETGGMEQKLEALKNVSVLILDDLGAEAITAWTRDEVLGPILQRRMEKLPTIYTSNLKLDELEQHFAKAKNSEANYRSAARIMERIEPFVEYCEVKGRNRRRNQTSG
ncbi:primosomal protein DnaI [Brevibacillus sp. MER 51]|uniref:primosomal protein DnaI n=1 Tax=Brevibacillus sp. MER 51 TaxID=2939560 RepID=UPI0020422BA6|nr:primosomal protein DnaI [Brevibacillus sp. MER 51]MCM3145357.1 primosomal protein DnaI [Brevibacillus sp. MER 51]